MASTSSSVASTSTTQQRLSQVLNHVQGGANPSNNVAAKTSESKKVVELVFDAESGVSIITINNPPVNALSKPVLAGLREALAQANTNPKCKAIVITGAGSAFVAGADISMLQQQIDGKQDPAEFIASNVSVLDSLEQPDSCKPAVAAINGVCLGGGLELAMACCARVAAGDSGVLLGLPELTLGVIPGFGGTQRLPRLVGLNKALDMMLTSKPINAREAHELGLVDALVPHTGLLAAASQLALNIASSTTPRSAALFATNKLPTTTSEAEAIINEAKQRVIAKYGAAQLSDGLPQYSAVIEAISVGVIEGPQAGYQREAALFSSLIRSKTARSLIHVFFASRATARVPGVKPVNPSTAIANQSIAVIGGGLMGSGIAAVALLAGYSVLLKEINQPLLTAALQRVRSMLPPPQADFLFGKLKGTTEYSKSEFGAVGLAIEAAVENLQAKQQIFAQLEAVCSPQCIFATNTSTLRLQDVAARFADPGSRSRLVGLHFFSPARVMPLLEIVRSPETANSVVGSSLAFAKRARKTPIVVGSCPGFAVNRMFHGYGRVACYLAERYPAITPGCIDAALKRFGMPMGFFAMADMAGVDILRAASAELSRAFADRSCPSSLLDCMVAENRLGQKSGSEGGFYLYTGVHGSLKPTAPSPHLQRIIALARVKDNIDPLTAETLSSEEIVEAMLLPVVNEAARLLHENMVVGGADALDVASILGMGFPAFRGGILHWATVRYLATGSAGISARLRHWLAVTGQSIFAPSTALLEFEKSQLAVAAAKAKNNSTSTSNSKKTKAK